MHQFGSFTDRAIPLDFTTYGTSCSHQFWVGLADVGEIQYPAAKIGQHRRAGEPIVDMAFGATRGSRRYAKHSTNDRRSFVANRAYVMPNTPSLCGVRHRNFWQSWRKVRGRSGVERRISTDLRDGRDCRLPFVP